MNLPERESLRHTVLELLALRFPNALTADQVRFRAAQQVDFTLAPEDVLAALEYLAGLTHVQKHVDSLGSTQYWSATTSGVQAYERLARKG